MHTGLMSQEKVDSEVNPSSTVKGHDYTFKKVKNNALQMEQQPETLQTDLSASMKSIQT